jgi:pilus assembly protein Flp/PilA
MAQPLRYVGHSGFVAAAKHRTEAGREGRGPARQAARNFAIVWSGDWPMRLWGDGEAMGGGRRNKVGRMVRMTCESFATTTTQTEAKPIFDSAHFGRGRWPKRMGCSGLVVSQLYLRGFDMKNAIQNFLRDEEGAVAIEYALLAGLIACGIIVAATTLASNLSTFFTAVGTKLTNLKPS